MLVYDINYPDRIDTIQQLNIFFDYVVHGILDDELKCPVEFQGVRTETEPWANRVSVIVPLKMTAEDYFRNKDFLNTCLNIVCYNLIDRSIVPLTLRNIDIKILVENISLPERIDIKVKLKEREENKMYVPEVKEIVHKESNRGEFFRVVWGDDSTTTVKLMEGDTSDEYTAFLYALGKKLFENKGEVRKFIKEKKQVFEDRVAKKSAEKARQRRQQAIQQSLDFDDIPEAVYRAGFVAPCMMSKAKNQRR